MDFNQKGFEALNTINPSLSNDIIYDALYNIENWLRNIDKLPLFKTLSKIFNDPTIEIRGYGVIDKENGVDFSLKSILGNNIRLNVRGAMQKIYHYTFSIDNELLYNHLYEQFSKYTTSYFYQFLLKNYTNIRLVMPESSWQLVLRKSKWKLKLLEYEKEFNFWFEQNQDKDILYQIEKNFNYFTELEDFSKIGLEPWSDGNIDRDTRYYDADDHQEIQRFYPGLMQAAYSKTTFQYKIKITCTEEFYNQYSSDYLFYELCNNGYLEISNIKLLK
jgi:hypothetical protein